MPTEPATIAVFAVTRKRARCSGPNCRAHIEWAVIVATNRVMCFTGTPPTLSTYENEAGRRIDVLPLDANHWATCPDAARFKKSKPAKEMVIAGAERRRRTHE